MRGNLRFSKIKGRAIAEKDLSLAMNLRGFESSSTNA